MVPGLVLCDEGYEAQAWDLGCLVLKIYIGYCPLQ